MSKESNCVRCNKHPKKAGESVCKVCYDSGSGYFDMVGNDLADYFEWPDDKDAEEFGAEDVIEEALLSLDGENVAVLVSSLVFPNGTSRSGYFPQLSINGRLGINTSGEITEYSIVNSEDTYVYFYARDVRRIFPPSSVLERRPTIEVRMDTPQEGAEEFGAEETCPMCKKDNPIIGGEVCAECTQYLEDEQDIFSQSYDAESVVDIGQDWHKENRIMKLLRIVARKATGSNARYAKTYAREAENAYYQYGMRGLTTQVAYVLSNLSGWRGEEAKSVKAELRKLIK